MRRSITQMSLTFAFFNHKLVRPFSVSIADDKNMQLSIDLDNLNESSVITSSVLLVKVTWYHIAVTFETNNYNLCIDGKLVASSIGSNSRTLILSQTHRLINVDEIRIYSRTMKMKEMKALAFGHCNPTIYFYQWSTPMQRFPSLI